MLTNEQTKKPKEVILSIRNSVKLDPQNPIPIQYGGNSFYVVSGKKYIPFLGKKDNLPNLLLEARLTSTTQNACITSISQSVIGKGITVIDVKSINPEFEKWMKSVNNNQQSLNDVCLNIIDGERTTGNQFIEIKRLEVAGKKFIKIYLHPMQYCRLAEPDENDNTTAVLISKLFARKGYRDIDISKTKTIPLWSDNILDKNKVWLDNKDGSFSTMLHFKNEVQGVDYYGMPASCAGLRYQVLEGKSAQFNIDNFENNLILGGMLIFKSGMTQEEAEKNGKEILLSHIGSGKNGRIAIISSEGGLSDVDWKPYETQKEGSFIEFDKRVEQKIIAANGWDAILAGIHTNNSSLGNGSGYVRSIYDIKESTLLKPLRLKLIEKVINPIAKIYAEFTGAKEVQDYQFDFNSSMPFSFMADIDPESFMKLNEARKLAGLEVDESKKEQYLFEMSGKKNSKEDVQNKPPTS